MVDWHEILDAAERIVEQFAPRQILLFGSYAYGSPNPDSNVDLLIVTGYRGVPYRKAAQIATALGSLPFSMDLLVRHPAELAKRVRLNDQLLKEAVEKGIVLHDATDERMSLGGRKRLQRRFDSLPSAQSA